MSTTTVARCWQCRHEHTPRLFCPRCDAIQSLPSDTDYFTVFDLPRKPALDEQTLSTTYYELSRRLHPDLHQTGTAAEQQASLANTALLNRAYRTLRDPIRRGRYWLTLHGEQLGKENNRVPPKLAALVFEVQEKLAEARTAGSAGQAQSPAGHDTELDALRRNLDTRLQRLRGALDANFSEWREGEPSAELLNELKRLLSELAYLGTLIRDVDKEVSQAWNASSV